jgi:hypothetical protein
VIRILQVSRKVLCGVNERYKEGGREEEKGKKKGRRKEGKKKGRKEEKEVRKNFLYEEIQLDFFCFLLFLNTHTEQ